MKRTVWNLYGMLYVDAIKAGCKGIAAMGLGVSIFPEEVFNNDSCCQCLNMDLQRRVAAVDVLLLMGVL